MGKECPGSGHFANAYLSTLKMEGLLCFLSEEPLTGSTERFSCAELLFQNLSLSASLPCVPNQTLGFFDSRKCFLHLTSMSTSL